MFSMIGMDVIIRTFAAGVWFGTLVEKNKNEVILHNARRMWRWKCKKGISLSETALYGIDDKESRICAAVPQVWIEAIEIIPVSEESAKDLREAPDAKAR